MRNVPLMSLADIAESVRYGYTASASDREIGPKFLRITDIVPPQIDWASVPYCEIDEKNLAKFSLEPGDIVIARTGATVGYAKLIRDNEPSVFASYLVRIRVDPEKSDSGYIGRIVESEVYKRFVLSRVGGAAQPNVNAKVLSSFRLPIPEKATQRRIASILSAYDDLIENNRRRIQLLEESARLLYREWFFHLRFPGHEHVKIINGVPEGWEKNTISKLGDVVTGKTPSTKDPDNFGGKIPFIKTPDMHKNPIVIESAQYLSEKGANSQTKKYIPKDSIMVSCIGTVGVVAISAIKAQTNQQINTIIPQKDHFRYYVYFALSDLKSRLEAMGGGATMVNVNKGKFESLPIVIPSDSILQEFHEVCNPIFLQIRNLLIQNQKIKTARDIMLPRFMNGEIEV